MKYEIDAKIVNEALEKISELEKLLEDRIQELHQAKGGQESRHCHIFYRKLLWEVKYALIDNVKEVKEKAK